MKKLLSVVAIIIVVVLGAWLLFSKRMSPEQRLQIAFVNLINATNGHLRASVAVKSDPATSATLSEFKINVDGNFQKGNGGQLDFDAGVNVESSKTGVTVGGKGSVRLVDGKLFYKFDEMPDTLADIAAIRGKWLSGTTKINLLSDTARANMISSFQKPQLFTSIKQNGKEKVGSINTTHFQAIFSTSGYASFVEEVSKLSGGVAPINKTDLENSVKVLNNVPFDIWIDSGNQLRKVAVSYLNPQNKANVNVEVLFTPYVGTTKIEEPQDVLKETQPTPIATPVATPAK